MLEDRSCGVAEEQLFAGPAVHAHDDQVVAALFRLRENGLVGSHVGAHGGFDLDIVAVGDLDDVLENGLLLPASTHAATPSAPIGLCAGHIEHRYQGVTRASDRNCDLGRTP